MAVCSICRTSQVLVYRATGVCVPCTKRDKVDTCTRCGVKDDEKAELRKQVDAAVVFYNRLCGRDDLDQEGRFEFMRRLGRQ